MDFHGNINLQNQAEIKNLNIEEVSSLPTWQSSDEGRLLYDQTTNGLYYGNDTGWFEIGDALTFDSTFTVTSNNVSLNASLDDLNDVSGTSSANTGEVVAKGASGFTAKKIYHNYTSGSASTSHVITHNLGQRLVICCVTDSDYNVMLPENVEYTDSNTVTVTFNTAIDCKVVVMGIATS